MSFMSFSLIINISFGNRWDLFKNHEFNFSRSSEGVEKKNAPFLNVVFIFISIRIGLVRFGLALLHVRPSLYYQSATYQLIAETAAGMKSEHRRRELWPLYLCVSP